MHDRLIIAYSLMAVLALAFLTLAVILVRRRRADHVMRYGQRARRRRT
jgi:hypothetical protein